MLILHAYAMSPFNDKVLRLLNHKGIACEVREYALGDSKVKQLNPSGKLPCLEHDGKLVPDSTDIVYYIEKQFPERSLMPTEPQQQALLHIIEDWADESLYFYEMHLRFGIPANGEKNIPNMLVNNTGLLKWFLRKVIPGGLRKITHNQGVGRKSLQQLDIDLHRHCSAVSKLLDSGDWLLGDALTIADLAVHPMFTAFEDAPEAVAVMSQYPNITAWKSRLRAATDQRAEV